MLVFITSTAKDLYRRDLLNVFCKPTDDLVSFSYNKDRISSTVNGDVKAKEALIVFAAYKEQSPKITYYPVRKCKIIDVVANETNTSFTYHLKLGHSVKYKYEVQNPSTNDKLLSDFDQEVKSQLEVGENNDVTKYYFRDLKVSTNLEFAPLEDPDTWPNLVRYMGTLPAFKESIFFRQMNTEQGNIDFKVTSLANLTPIKLVPGKTYNLYFLLISGSEIKGSGVYPTIETSPNVNVQGPFVSQESNAVALRYVIIVKASISTSYSTFIMRVKNGKVESTPVSPEISTYLSLKPRKIINLFTFLVLVFGLVAANIADLLPKAQAYRFFGIVDIDRASLVAVIKLVASAVVTFISFFIYRKIPKSE